MKGESRSLLCIFDTNEVVSGQEDSEEDAEKDNRPSFTPEEEISGEEEITTELEAVESNALKTVGSRQPEMTTQSGKAITSTPTRRKEGMSGDLESTYQGIEFYRGRMYTWDFCRMKGDLNAQRQERLVLVSVCQKCKKKVHDLCSGGESSETICSNCI